MSETANLFSPFRLGGRTLPNRIVVSPMCQYSSTDGFATDWHLVHLGSRAVGGAWLVIVEATAVSPEGRITPHDLGLWKDEHIPKLKLRRFLRKPHPAAAGSSRRSARRTGNGISSVGEDFGNGLGRGRLGHRSIGCAWKILKIRKVDLIDISSGALVPYAKIPAGPGFQTPFAERIRPEADIPTGTVGLITAAAQADQIIRNGQADFVMIAREFLRYPYWPLQAAAEVHQQISWPKQYLRAAATGTTARDRIADD